MLRPEALARILEQANTGGVKCTLLLDQDGTLIGSSGEWITDSIETAAVASNLWSTFERARRPLQNPVTPPGLDCAVLEYDQGLVGLTKVEGTHFIVCSLASRSEECPMPMLRKKITSVADYLIEPLKDFPRK